MMREKIVREAKRKLLGAIHSVQAGAERRRVNEILRIYDPEAVRNPETIPAKSPAECRILFLITRMVRFHGGQTSVLRLGTELAKQGFSVGYAVYKAQSREEMQICASGNLPEFKGELYPREELFGQNPAVVIATSWDTVSIAKKLPGYRMYFVQDYEPYFYTFGELFLLAKKTYEQGLHMVSLGKWNRDMILKECKPVSPVDVVDFPCEKSEYPPVKRDFAAYRGKKKLVFAVYLKYYGKRLPCVIPYLIEGLQAELNRDGITLDVRYYGEAKSFSSKGGRNLGMLNRSELAALYAEADFGMVASMSNISLVPYEMIASGLPLIEFEDGTFRDFFPEDCAILTSFSAKDLYRKLMESLNHPEILEERTKRAQACLQTISWKRTGEQFAGIIRSRMES